MKNKKAKKVEQKEQESMLFFFHYIAQTPLFSPPVPFHHLSFCSALSPCARAENAAREARRAAAKERTVESTTSWNSLYDTKTDENAPKANSSLFSFNFDSKQIEEAHDDENDAFVHPQLKRESVDQTNTQNKSQANDDVIIEENPFAGIKLSEVPFTISYFLFFLFPLFSFSFLFPSFLPSFFNLYSHYFF